MCTCTGVRAVVGLRGGVTRADSEAENQCNGEDERSTDRDTAPPEGALGKMGAHQQGAITVWVESGLVTTAVLVITTDCPGFSDDLQVRHVSTDFLRLDIPDERIDADGAP
jgi:hypothetical protein